TASPIVLFCTGARGAPLNGTKRAAAAATNCCWNSERDSVGNEGTGAMARARWDTICCGASSRGGHTVRTSLTSTANRSLSVKGGKPQRLQIVLMIDVWSSG